MAGSDDIDADLMRPAGLHGGSRERHAVDVEISIPKEPHRRPQMGFLYLPPYRVQGVSIAGEETVIQIPELDVCFDVGLVPRAALTSKYVALTHGHMDHSAGISYYFSQRNFQGPI